MEQYVLERNEYNIKKLEYIKRYIKIKEQGIIKLIKLYSIPEIESNKYDNNHFSIQEKIYGIRMGLGYTNNNGSIIKSSYKNDKLDKSYKYYYCYNSQLSLHKSIQYENGIILYTKIYYPSKNSQIKGKLKEKYSFDQDNLLNGKHYEYNDQTNEKILTIYKHGIPINTNIY